MTITIDRTVSNIREKETHIYSNGQNLRFNVSNTPNNKDSSPCKLNWYSNPTSLATSSPYTRNRSHSKNIYSDRFIPSRTSSHLDAGFCLFETSCRRKKSRLADTLREEAFGLPRTVQTGSNEINNNRLNNAENKNEKDGNITLSLLLKNELLGFDAPSPLQGPDGNNTTDLESRISSINTNIFRFKTPIKKIKNVRSPNNLHSFMETTQMSNTVKRKIPDVPFKVLDAPALQDDFYLNLVDWSSLNVLAVGLSSSVYLWSACTSKVTKLCDLAEQQEKVTSVAWTSRGTHLAIGTSGGDVQIWDILKCKLVQTMEGHLARVGALAWNSHVIASGSRDHSIFQRDIRINCNNATTKLVNKFSSHKQEVCGLKWSFDGKQLASGGNDNKLFIWSAYSTNPILRYNDHIAAVKALAWSPHQNGIIASGGGTADRCIRFRNTLTGSTIDSIDTGSQVCNLMWSKNVNEVVSTHGYSLNQIILWSYPTMKKLATLSGHTYRVLYLSMSPDGQTIVTGAGDQTLRFWTAFPGTKRKNNNISFGENTVATMLSCSGEIR